MTERPILFKGEMVRAILEGRKTQTRRLRGLDIANDPENTKPVLVGCPYGVPGDLLWVRETFRLCSKTDRGVWTPLVEYRADGETIVPRSFVFSAYEKYSSSNWRPSIFMPRWASRITLEITEVRVERLQDITEADAVAEGIEEFAGIWRNYRYAPKSVYDGEITPVQSYASLWRSINGAESWDANPWVWVVAFKHLPAAQAGSQ